MAIPEHEVFAFIRVQSALEGLQYERGMTVQSTGPLAKALGKLGCLPFVKIFYDSFDLDCEFLIGDKPAGTLEKPDVDLILQDSVVSSFGKGQTTVLDLSYRNGREIPAQYVTFISKNNRNFVRTSEDEISAAMFVGKTVKLKLYKLAVYEEGGHFNWHMDSTHSDRHHATFLLALNTSWKGGNLKLRRNGVETLVDMHPKADREGGGISLHGAAFYTDTEHKVEPVTEGIRIILQYDVEVVGWGENSAVAVKRKDGDDENETDKEEDEDKGEEEADEEKDLFDRVRQICKKRKYYEESSGSVDADNTIVTKVTNLIAGLLAEGTEHEVAFAMQHLYRKSSILPEFLKGADAQLYRSLVGSFDVALRPVILHSTRYYCNEGWDDDTHLAIPWDQSDKSGSESGAEKDDETRNKEKKVMFHLPMLSAIKQISYQSYVEHTGNEAQPEEKKYFGGGMFVRQKTVAKE